MKGMVLLSHGLDSSPDATKVSALAVVARSQGWDEFRPDYRDLDASGDARRIGERIERLLRHAPPAGTPLVLVGSSMGAFISGFASLRVRARGLFLMAPPMEIPGYPDRFDQAAVPTEVVHGWHDELIAADAVIDFARASGQVLHLVDDDHRLGAHVNIIAGWFSRFLSSLG